MAKMIVSLIMVFMLGMPPVIAGNSVGFRFGYNFFTGDREDVFASGDLDHLYFYSESWKSTRVDSFYHGSMDMDASNFFIGGELNIALPFNTHLQLSPGAEYYQNSVSYDPGAVLYYVNPAHPAYGSCLYLLSDQVDYSLFSVLLNVKYLFFEEGKRTILPYAGGGVGVNRWNIDLERHSSGRKTRYWRDEVIYHGSAYFINFYENDGISFGAQILGGLGIAVHPRIEPFFECQYRYMQKANIEVVKSEYSMGIKQSLDDGFVTVDFSGLQVLGGVRFKL